MWKFFNLFSQSPALKINGESRATSIFGSIIGFLICSILIGATSIILNDFFARLNFTLNSYTDNSAIPDIKLKNFKIGFILSDLMGKEFPDAERLFTISAMYWDIFIPKFTSNQTKQMSIVSYEPIPTIKCNQYRNDTIFKDNFEKISEGYNMTCLDIPGINKTLKGVYANLGK